jgi:hypothetical protein
MRAAMVFFLLTVAACAGDDGAPEQAEADSGSSSDQCVRVMLYLDQDVDGYGLASKALGAGCPSAGHVAVAGDCDDTNADAHPGQAAWFATASSQSIDPFDFNCDGKEEKRWTAVFTFSASSSSCTLTAPGWSAYSPACGAKGTWVTSVDKTCKASETETRTQECR